MAHTEKLGRWLIDNSDAINLQVQRSLWVREWLPGFFDVGVQIEVASKIFKGRGFAENEDLAFLKAGAEAIERAICNEYKIRSNGVAVHTGEDAAKLGAKLELIERDLILAHHFCGARPLKILDLDSRKVDFKKIRSQLRDQEIWVELYELSASPEIRAVHCVATDSKNQSRFGSIMGSSCTIDLESCCIKALSECLINVVAWLSGGNTQALTLAEFNSKSSHEPVDHSALYLHPESKTFLDYLSKRNTSHCPQTEVNLDKIEVTELRSFDSILNSAPIFCYKAFSNQLQSIFYGPTELSKLNLPRILEFDPTLQNYNFTPHPIG